MFCLHLSPLTSSTLSPTTPTYLTLNIIHRFSVNCRTKYQNPKHQKRRGYSVKANSLGIVCNPCACVMSRIFVFVSTPVSPLQLIPLKSPTKPTYLTLNRISRFSVNCRFSIATPWHPILSTFVCNTCAFIMSRIFVFFSQHLCSKLTIPSTPCLRLLETPVQLWVTSDPLQGLLQRTLNLFFHL